MDDFCPGSCVLTEVRYLLSPRSMGQIGCILLYADAYFIAQQNLLFVHGRPQNCEFEPYDCKD